MLRTPNNTPQAIIQTRARSVALSDRCISLFHTNPASRQADHPPALGDVERAQQHEIEQIEGQRRLEGQPVGLSVASKMAPPSQPPTAMPAMANSMTTPSRQPAMVGP